MQSLNYINASYIKLFYNHKWKFIQLPEINWSKDVDKKKENMINKLRHVFTLINSSK